MPAGSGKPAGLSGLLLLAGVDSTARSFWGRNFDSSIFVWKIEAKSTTVILGSYSICFEDSYGRQCDMLNAKCQMLNAKC